MADLEKILAQADANQAQALERLYAFLRIESISTDPAFASECVRAAHWLRDELSSLGFSATCHETPGHPMVTAHSSAPDAQSSSHLLFYGHYDVQPVDPLELWHKPPFEPALEETENGPVIRARGAADDKGQLMTFVEACRAW